MPSADALTTLEPQPATARLKGWRTRDAAYRAERCRWFSLAEILPPGHDINVMVGPVVRRPASEPAWPPWYFVTGSSDGEFFATQIGAANRAAAERLRPAVTVALTQRRPIVIIPFEDELEMARCCEALWPGEPTRQVREHIEAERRR